MKRLQIPYYASLLGCVLAGLVFPPLALAQGDQVTVPDVTGLGVPAATALLNQNGMALGNQYGELWTEASSQPANTIGAQSLAPGSTVDWSTALEVTVLRSPNMLLMYDAESITLINQADVPVNLQGLTFNAQDGNTPAIFPAANWTGMLDGSAHCAQLWAVPQRQPQRPAACAGIERWLSTVNAASISGLG
jgi:hypothetical protein